MNKISKILLNAYGALALRILIGGVFIFAGIAKLPNIKSLIWETQQYQILPDSILPVFAHVLPIIEIIIGALLIFGIITKISSISSALLLAVFTFVKISALLRGLDIETCPCFGPSVILHSVDSLVLGIVLLVFSIYVFVYDKNLLGLDAIIFSVKRDKKNWGALPVREGDDQVLNIK